MFYLLEIGDYILKAVGASPNAQQLPYIEIELLQANGQGLGFGGLRLGFRVRVQGLGYLAPTLRRYHSTIS